MVINCQSVRQKGPQLVTVVEYVNPDAIIGTESWLDSTVKTSECFPSNFNVYHKERSTATMGEGVFIAIKDWYTSNELPSTDEKCVGTGPFRTSQIHVYGGLLLPTQR